MSSSKRKKHAGGRPPLPEQQRLSTQVGLRLGLQSTARLDAIVKKTRGFVSRATICRVAAEQGLAIVERDLRLLFADDNSADLLLLKCWGAEGALGGAEFNHPEGRFVVWLGPLDEEARSKTSFGDALDRLAAKVPPKRPLPWA